MLSNTARTRGDMKDRALVLRLDHDMPVSQIAERLGVPRSTVGGWVRGHGEARIFVKCAFCQETTLAGSRKRRFCNGRCQRQYHTFFGAIGTA